MKTQKMKPKNKRFSSGVKRPVKRTINMRGTWKAIEVDPSLFSEEGLEGLVCFEELTNYRLVDTEKAAAKAAKQLQKEEKKHKKRKISEPPEAGENGEEPTEPAGKKAKKKRKKTKATAEESVKSHDAGEEELKQEEKNACQEGGEAKVSDEAAEDSEGGTQAGKAKKRSKERKKKKPRQRTEEDEGTAGQANLEAPSEKEKPSQDRSPKPPKKQAKNWTNAARSGCEEMSSDVSAWKDLFAPAPVLRALSSLGFGSPTPIQALALPPAIRDRLDILGAAETGSGKTLAFGIPMIHAILEWKSGSEENADDGGQPVESLYLPPVEEPAESGSPTEADGDANSDASEEGGLSDPEEKDPNELPGCVQVIEKAEFDLDADAAAGRRQPLLGLVLTPTRELAVQVKHHIDAVAKFTDIKTAIVVGGMAQQKQRRMLKRRPEIIIATPGRLWDLIKERHPHLLNLRLLKCLVIDEADRMVERGHFAELESLLEMLNTTHFNPTRQTFVFSATLTMAHVLPTRLLQKKKKNLDKRSKLEILMEKVGIRLKPKVIDLTRKEATVETLTETQIHCQKEEKDFYLYYFLLQYPGRTMVFANSIDCIKRLNSLLVILDCTPLPLHANMHQKQRLKNLERFAERESCVLLTTDVAARGLDIPDVQHVIHYQVPRTSETYVHRSGRTARATKEGLSLLLTGPDDMVNFKKIYKALGKDEELPTFPVESKCMEAIKERVNLARKIEKIEFYNSREKQHDSWFRQAAEALELDLDEDILLGGGKDDDDDREQRKMVKGMKKHLKLLTSQPIFRDVIKTKYPTQLGKLPPMFHSGIESALTTVSTQQNKQKLKKAVQPQQKKQKQRKGRRQEEQ
ncbi:unnamed protein product [Menidia menidia]|uniref:ATP-dependent RNA helicase n=1 Tax=Menidia menidia TaxID=238744 RepID=A0A8S4APT8_9TELE|nr:unnamed protein product [Menidia menidia]